MSLFFHHFGIQHHLFYHGQESVGTCWRQVFLETYFVEKGKVGSEDVVRSLSGKTFIKRLMMPFVITASLSAVK